MKIRFLSTTLVGLSALGTILPTQAREFEDSMYLTGLLGYHYFDSERRYEDDPSIAGGLGYEFNRSIAAEVIYGAADLERKPDDLSDTNSRFTRLDLLYHFDDGTAWRPFIIGGGGDWEWERNGSTVDETQFNLGAGIKHEISESTDLRLDARGVYGNQTEAKDVMLNLGVTILFAGLIEPPQDEDGDGVFDDEDQCPGTAYGATVDTTGCEIIGDSDGDGVKDDVDQCPNTPAGATVNEEGCPMDSDGDGVADADDQCPGTAAGTPVDAKGCPADTDGDGVGDGKDACPGTPAGAKVDDKGCRVKLTGVVTATLSVNFAHGSTELTPDSAGELEKVAKFMREYPDESVTIEGHTDSSGSDQVNLRISQQRADSVRQALVDQYGVAPERITAIGYGESQPIADNSTAEGRQQNRRVVAKAEAKTEE